MSTKTAQAHFPWWQRASKPKECDPQIGGVLDMGYGSSGSILTCSDSNALQSIWIDRACTFRATLLFFPKCEWMDQWLVHSKIGFFGAAFTYYYKDKKNGYIATATILKIEISNEFLKVNMFFKNIYRFYMHTPGIFPCYAEDYLTCIWNRFSRQKT